MLILQRFFALPHLLEQVFSLPEQVTAEELTQAGSDHTALARISANLANAQTKVAAAEENWIALAAEAEAQGLDTQ